VIYSLDDDILLNSISASTLYSGTTNLSDLFLFKSDKTFLQNGINTFTAGTSSAQSVNVTALTINTIVASGNSNFNTLSATTLSAGTINSGSTNLYDIFALPSQISTNNNGINTFTAGTSNFQSINVTGLSINNISVSGNFPIKNISWSADDSMLSFGKKLINLSSNTEEEIFKQIKTPISSVQWDKKTPGDVHGLYYIKKR
jgi:hypothetical protein